MKVTGKLALTATFAASSMLFVALPTEVRAQDSGASDSGGLEEIIVSARRRDENLQSAPVSVAAFSGTEIERSGMITAFDIGTRTPSLQLNFLATGEPEVFIRGAGTDIEGAGANSAVAFFVDDAYLARGGGALADMYDIERVEVLRGPQSTYYGKNVSGGAINFVTRKPSQDTDARMSLEIGNNAYMKTQGMVNGALSDSVSGRFAFTTRTRDGFTTNVNTGNKMDDVDVTGARAALLFEPSDTTSILVSADTYKRRGGTLPNKLVYATDPNEQVYITGLGPFEQFSSIDGLDALDSDNFLVKAEFETGIGTLTSLTNFRETSYDWNQNSTGNLYPDGIQYAVINQVWYNTFGTRCTTPDYADTGASGNCWASINQSEPEGRGGIYYEQTSQEQVSQWSQEIRLTSDNDGGFNWTGGIFFANEKIDRLDSNKYAIRFGPGDTYDCSFWAIPPCTGVQGSWNEGTEHKGGHIDADIFGAFVELDFDLTDRLSVSLSTRYSQDDKQFTENQWGRLLNSCACTVNADGSENPSWHPVASDEWIANPGTPTADSDAVVIPIEFGETDSWDNMSSRISLNWQITDDVFVYGLISEGYKGGGWEGHAANGQPTLYTTKFDEEKAINYEVGIRSDFMDGRGRVNLTAFFSEYDDLQMTLLKPVFDPVSGTVIDSNALTTNVGKAEASGAELEFAFIPFDGFTISGSYGLLSTEIKDDVLLLINVDPDVIENFRGNELARAPENSYNLNANYTWDVGGATAGFNLEYNWSDEYWSTNRNHIAIPDQDFMDASFIYISANEQWELKVWGRNITDELNLANHVWSGDPTETLDTLLLYDDYTEPRTYGVTFTWNYQ
jgi:iron complex outermembrane receptor protein